MLESSPKCDIQSEARTADYPGVLIHRRVVDGDDPTVRANLRSPWDTMHPGREWAYRDPKMQDARPKNRILAELGAHFASMRIYPDLDAVLNGFIDELRQL